MDGLTVKANATMEKDANLLNETNQCCPSFSFSILRKNIFNIYV